MKRVSWFAVIIPGLVLMLAGYFATYVLIYSERSAPAKNVAAESNVVETINDSIDGAVDIAKCPSCVFDERHNDEGDKK